MTNQVFDYHPSVEMLQILARGSLKQNLPKAVRLWVILQSLYGEEANSRRLLLGETFTYSDWNKQFFTQTNQYHKDDTIPSAHDPKCSCTKTLADWLFDPNMGCNSEEWQESFLKLYHISKQELNNLLSEGSISEAPANHTRQKRLPGGRLFAVTRKNLQYDFQALSEMGWLEIQEIQTDKVNRKKTQYGKVQKFPHLAVFCDNSTTEPEESAVRNVIQNDLVDFFEDFGQEINGENRFIFDIEYIVHHKFSQQINRLREQLKEIWHQSPVQPIKITYISARNYQNYQDEGEDYIVYPVCLCYSHRAPYLFAFGQTPTDKLKTDKSKLDWYDFRLDRMQNLLELKWDDVHIPGLAQEICLTKTPKRIEKLRDEAWGFDFYKPQDLLLVRFDRYFHYRYIEGTQRDELFTKISYKLAKSLIVNATLGDREKQQLLTTLSLRSPDDIYCRLNYRVGDNNIIMRLRAWGPTVEVFLPGKLRDIMAQDIQNTYRLYHS